MTDMTPQAGDFGLVPTFGDWHEKLAGWAIRFGTDAPVNHAFLYAGGGDIIEAAPGGARRVPLSNYDPATITWSSRVITPTTEQRCEIVDTAQSFADRHVGYGYADIVAIAFAQNRLGGRINPLAPLDRQPWWVRRIESFDTLICSQLVDVCYETAGARLFTDGRLPGLVSPGDLWRRLGSPAVTARS